MLVSLVLARLFKEGPDGFRGGLSAENYITIAKTSRATAALVRTGELRHTRYWLAGG
jgi:hypothetical protein